MKPELSVTLAGLPLSHVNVYWESEGPPHRIFVLDPADWVATDQADGSTLFASLVDLPSDARLYVQRLRNPCPVKPQVVT
jgi:hypothetical protein